MPLNYKWTQELDIKLISGRRICNYMKFGKVNNEVNKSISFLLRNALEPTNYNVLDFQASVTH